MMQTEREYAEALFSLATEEAAVDAYLCSLDMVKQVVEENSTYIEFLNSPAIPLSERLQSLDEAFESHVPEHVISFLKVLCENGKIRAVMACIEEFAKLAMMVSNQTVATIYSAVLLNDEQKDKITEKLEKLVGKSIIPVYQLDETLIGGIKIEVDGKTFDGSVKHRLGAIKDVMNS